MLGFRGETLRVRVTAAPEAGLANRAVVKLLAEALAVPPSSIELASGAASRDKRFCVAGHSLHDIIARLDGVRS